MMRLATFAIVLALGSLAFAEDVIELDSGRVLKGRIVREEKAWVGIDSGGRVLWLERDEIKSIQYDEAREREQPKPAPAPAPSERSDDEKVDEETPKPTRDRPIPSESEAARRRAAAAVASVAAEDGEELSAEAALLRQGLASEDRDERLMAADWILETWPKWRSAVEFALTKEKSETACLEAVRLLDHEEVRDPVQLVDSALDNESAKVRMTALRVARHRNLTGLESRALDLMRKDPTWAVRQEAIRTLEDIGGATCLPHVMAAWSSETDKDRRRRYRRVMKTLLGDDFGDDAKAWYAAADELFMGRRVLRKGKVDDDSR